MSTGVVTSLFLAGSAVCQWIVEEEHRAYLSVSAIPSDPNGDCHGKRILFNDRNWARAQHQAAVQWRMLGTDVIHRIVSRLFLPWTTESYDVIIIHTNDAFNKSSSGPSLVLDGIFHSPRTATWLRFETIKVKFSTPHRPDGIWILFFFVTKSSAFWMLKTQICFYPNNVFMW